MNFLLRDLQAKGVMRHDCIAFNDDRHMKKMMTTLPARAIMHMGDNVRPGPFWAVHAEDVPALEAAGYTVRIPATKSPAPGA
jgi:hypothetical protein